MTTLLRLQIKHVNEMIASGFLLYKVMFSSAPMFVCSVCYTIRQKQHNRQREVRMKAGAEVRSKLL